MMLYLFLSRELKASHHSTDLMNKLHVFYLDCDPFGMDGHHVGHYNID